MTPRPAPPGSNHFDVVLVVEYFRTAAPFLAVATALGPTHRIGLCLAPVSPDMLRKAGASQDAFVAACLEAGAELVEGGGHTCDLMVVQQRPYPEEVARDILARVTPRRTVGLMALAMAGLDVHEAYLRQFAIDKVYAPNERFTRFLLARRGAEALYDGVAIEQVGLPFARTPLAPGFEADWIVATPTGFSFRRESHKHAFFRAVLALVDRIEPSDRIVYKPHNGESRDYLAPEGYARIARTLSRAPGALALAQAAARLPGPPGLHAAKLVTAMLHERLLRRCTPLRTLTKRDWLPFEAFLPGVRKGVIGGLSNTIWGTLYYGLPFYNCVDRGLRDSIEPDIAKGEKGSWPYLDVNLEFFGLPFCEGRLDSPHARRDDVIGPPDREGDLVDAVLSDLAAVRSTAS